VGSEAHHNRRQRDIEDRIIAPRRSSSAHLHPPGRAIQNKIVNRYVIEINV
jgi:hypothetical protein